MEREILIYGCGGHGRVILDILESQKKRVCGFIDNDKAKKGLVINKIRVLGSLNEIGVENRGKDIILGISDNFVRAEKTTVLKEAGYNIISAIHPSAIISKDARIGGGVVIMPGAIINTGAVIGNNVIINTNASIDHDCVIGDNCQIQPGAVITGTVTVEDYVTIGSGAVVLPNLRIGRGSFIGAGAVVTRNVEEKSVMTGVPARKIRSTGE